MTLGTGSECTWCLVCCSGVDTATHASHPSCLRFRYTGSDTAGATMATEFLKREGASDAVIERVVYIIDNISFSTELAQRRVRRHLVVVFFQPLRTSIPTRG